MDTHTTLTVVLTAVVTALLTALGTWLVNTKLQDRDREHRRRDLLREAYATWMASEDDHLEALINFLQVAAPASPLSHMTEEFAKRYGSAKTRSNTCGRVLQVLEPDDEYWRAVCDIAKAIPHAGDPALAELTRLAQGSETGITWMPYTKAVGALVDRLRVSRRLW